MNNNNLCPECGSPIAAGDHFCVECGAVLPELPVESACTDDDCVIGAGASVNVMEGIHKTTNNSTSVNTSQIDNSSTVNNNTTIVMGGKKTEFCEVCGDPLEEKHARCPKCGKHICFDCKVKGKNRCVECEKKCINEYRVAFQQLLLTTNGNIGVAGRQMMDQKARELELEDVKDKVEAEVIASAKPVAKVTPKLQEAKSVLPEEGIENQVETIGSKLNVKNVGVGGLAVAVLTLVVKMATPNDKLEVTLAVPDTEPKQVVVEQKQENVNKEPTAVFPTAAVSEKKAQPATQPAQTRAVQASPTQTGSPAPSVKKVDANFEAGMTAYNKGNGLDALKAFTSSASAEAYYMIGMIYKNGCGSVAKNEMMARKNFKKAAAMGHAGAKAEL